MSSRRIQAMAKLIEDISIIISQNNLLTAQASIISIREKILEYNVNFKYPPSKKKIQEECS